MGNPNGFLLNNRKDNNTIPPELRELNFQEFHTPLNEKERREQAGSCLRCGVQK